MNTGDGSWISWMGCSLLNGLGSGRFPVFVTVSRSVVKTGDDS